MDKEILEILKRIEQLKSQKGKADQLLPGIIELITFETFYQSINSI